MAVYSWCPSGPAYARTALRPGLAKTGVESFRVAAIRVSKNRKIEAVPATVLGAWVIGVLALPRCDQAIILSTQRSGVQVLAKAKFHNHMIILNRPSL
jgi:hypothetical protein